MIVSEAVFVIKRVGLESHQWSVGRADSGFVTLEIVGIPQSPDNIKPVVLMPDGMVFPQHALVERYGFCFGYLLAV